MQRHVDYHAHRERLAALDAAVDAAHDARYGLGHKRIRRREQTRLVSCSLPLADRWKSDTAHVKSDLFLVTLQFNTGLYLSCALDANRTLEAHGVEPDWLGDHTSDSAAAAGERNTRHDDGNVAWYRAAREAIATPVTLCVKGNRRDPAAWRRALLRYADFNAGHVPDWGAKGAAASGRHLVGEHKCYSPLVPFTLGTGTRGGVGMVGDRVALGNTEEGLVRSNFGVQERGVPGEPFNHATGAGHVKAHAGLYDDAVNVKGNTVLLLISEIFGGVNGTSLRFLARLAHLMRGDSDEPHFDRAGKVVPFFVYHARAISSAAALGHGKVLLKHANGLARRAAKLRGRAPEAEAGEAAAVNAADDQTAAGVMAEAGPAAGDAAGGEAAADAAMHDGEAGDAAAAGGAAAEGAVELAARFIREYGPLGHAAEGDAAEAVDVLATAVDEGGAARGDAAQAHAAGAAHDEHESAGEAPASEGVVGALVECVRTCVQACLPDCDARRVRACPSCSAACAVTDDFCPVCGVRARRVGARRARGGGGPHEGDGRARAE